MPMTDTQNISVLQAKVARLEAQVKYLYDHLAIPVQETNEFGADAEVVDHLRKGDMLGAIAAHRRIHNSSFPDAKRAVEDLNQRI